MGTVVRNTPRRIVYLFYSNVLRTLSITRSAGELPTAAETGMLARALARVLVHETVHSFAPDQPHTSAGLMGRRMRYRDFRVNRLEWTEGSATVFLEGLYVAAETFAPVHVASPK